MRQSKIGRTFAWWLLKNMQKHLHKNKIYVIIIKTRREHEIW